MNIRRGFNRLYFVLFCFWLVLILFIMPLQTVGERRQTNYNLYLDCITQNPAASHQQECRKVREELEAQTNLRAEYRNMFGANAIGNVAFILLLPAIVYGFLLGTGYTLQWIYRGFRPVDK